MLKRWVMVTCGVLAGAAPAFAWSAVFQRDSPPACKAAGSAMRLPGVSEASGLVASRTTPGRLWTHNDSGKPEIIALDAKGNLTGRVSLQGATLEDWEAMATGPCGNRTCLYIADIGDNDASRSQITIYRVPEPAKAGGSEAKPGVLSHSRSRWRLRSGSGQSS